MHFPLILIHVHQSSWEDKLSSRMFSKTGSLGRGWDHNCCPHKRKASRIQLLLFTSSGQPTRTHIHARYQASQQGSSSALETSQDTTLQQRTLGGERTGRKAKQVSGKSGEKRIQEHKRKRNQALFSTECII